MLRSPITSVKNTDAHATSIQIQSPLRFYTLRVEVINLVGATIADLFTAIRILKDWKWCKPSIYTVDKFQ